MIYAFEEFELDPTKWELRHRGVNVEIPPKVMQFLCFLVENRDRVLSNEELFSAVWPGVTVTEASVMKAVRSARKLLGDDGETQRIIKTLRGRGYRFAADVSVRSPTLRPSGLPVSNARTPSEPAVAPAGAFVGRAAELTELHAALDRTAEGRSAVLLVSGEAGMGKTRLAEAFATEAAAAGALVAWGLSSEDGGAPELWPWIQILRSLRDAGALGPDDEAAREALRILPESAGATAETLRELSTEAAQFRAFDAVSRALRHITLERRLVIILEDLHTADLGSLRLLRFVGRELREVGLLIAGTFRPAESGAAAELLAAGVSREARTLVLSGFGDEETRALVRDALSVEPDPELVRRVQALTEGNPFFVSEIARSLAARDPRTPLDFEEEALPSGIKEAVRRRLDALARATHALLQTASVVGRTFDVAVLSAVTGGLPADVARTLEPARARGIVTAVRGALGLYRFSHVLLRDVLYDDLAAPERAEVHRLVGEALESFSSPGAAPPSVQLALHFSRAALGAGSEKAARYFVQAAEEATNALGFDDAREHARRALEALRFPGAPLALRVDARVALGDAERRTGDFAAARETYRTALAEARSAGDAQRAARAALGFAETKLESNAPNEEVIATLREALSMLDAGPESASPAHREELALVLSRLATCSSIAGRAEEADMQSTRALYLARAGASPATLARALVARHWVRWRPGLAEERRAIAAEVIALDRTSGVGHVVAEARIGQITDLLELGSPDAFGRCLAEYEKVVRQLRDPLGLWNVRIFETSKAILEGRFEDAERIAQETLPIGGRIHEENAGIFYNAQMFGIRLEQGRGEELEPVGRELVEGHSENLSFRGALLRIYAEAGTLDRVEEQLERLTPSGNVGALPDDWLLTTTLSHFIVGCHAVGDTARAGAVYERLLPFDGTHAALGPAIVYHGPISLSIGIAARTMGKLEESVGWFRKAIAQAARLGARPTVARATYHLAEALFAGGYCEAAKHEAATSATEAAAMGMGNVAKWATALEARLGAG